MKMRWIAAAWLALSAALAVGEEPKDNLKAAVKKLADAANYSWTQETEMAGRGGGSAIKGKTEKGGFTILTTEGQDGTVSEAVLKADKGVLKSEGEWKTAEELPGFGNRQGGGGGGQRAAGDTRPRDGAGQGQGGGGRRGGFAGRRLLTTKTPAVVLEGLLGKVKEIKADGEALVGDLTEEGAKELMTFGRGGRRPGGNDAGGGAPAGPKNAKGSVKAWVKDGSLTKYEIQTEATVSFGGQENEVSQLTTVEIKDVGSTKVEAPEDAKKKLEGGAAKAAKPEEKKE